MMRTKHAIVTFFFYLIARIHNKYTKKKMRDLL